MVYCAIIVGDKFVMISFKYMRAKRNNCEEYYNRNNIIEYILPRNFVL